MSKAGDIRRALVHELANKVSALKSFVESRELNFDKDITLLVDNLDLLTRYLLDLELPGREVREREFVLSDVIEDVVSELYLTSKFKKVAIEVKGCNLKVKTDEFIFKRILYNLLHNAIKFSPQDSTVHVYCDAGDIWIENSVEKSDLMDLVGSGMGLDITKELASLINLRIDYYDLEDLFKVRIVLPN